MTASIATSSASTFSRESSTMVSRWRPERVPVARFGILGNGGITAIVFATSTENVRNARTPHISFFTVERVTLPSRSATSRASAAPSMVSMLSPKNAGHRAAYWRSEPCVRSSYIAETAVSHVSVSVESARVPFSAFGWAFGILPSQKPATARRIAAIFPGSLVAALVTSPTSMARSAPPSRYRVTRSCTSRARTHATHGHGNSPPGACAAHCSAVTQGSTFGRRSPAAMVTRMK